jgi:hypothetical protein
MYKFYPSVSYHPRRVLIETYLSTRSLVSLDQLVLAHRQALDVEVFEVLGHGGLSGMEQRVVADQRLYPVLEILRQVIIGGPRVSVLSSG